MQSRRDQVQAYTFTVGRLTSGMLTADPDAVDTPMNRTRRGGVIGLVIGALICVGFIVVGLLVPKDSDSWRKSGVLIMEKETGARYVYGAGTLRPVINYTSAKLITGDKGTVQQVSRNTLADVPRGTPIGIPGAPDSLPGSPTPPGRCAPPRARPTTGPWSPPPRSPRASRRGTPPNSGPTRRCW
jgi:type VII secretion protein EccB